MLLRIDHNTPILLPRLNLIRTPPIAVRHNLHARRLDVFQVRRVAAGQPVAKQILAGGTGNGAEFLEARVEGVVVAWAAFLV